MVDHLKLVLDSEGIFCVVRNRHLSSAAGRLPPNECWTELWVTDEEYSRAETIVEHALERTGTGEKSWVCARCGEKLEAQFEACWKCCTTRGALDIGSDTVEDGSGLPGLGRKSESSGDVPTTPVQAFWLVWGLMALVGWYLLRSYGESPW